jgi:hypothetical protein
LSGEELFASLLSRIDRRIGGNGGDYASYQSDPVGFAETVLGETLTDDVKQLMEAVRDYPITVAMSANAIGKTHAAGRLAAWFYSVFPESQVYTASAPPESNLKRLLWGEIGQVIEKHPELFKYHEQKILEIARSAKSFLVGVSIPTSGTEAQREGKFSGKHAPHLFFVVDEGDAVPDEIYKAIESCMTGGHCRLLVMLNPRYPSGKVYQMIRDGRAKVIRLSAFTHPNVVTGQDIIPGAVSREVTVRRLNEWCRPLTGNERPDSDCFELPGFLVGATAKDQAGSDYPPLKAGWFKIADPAFSYMVLGQYPGQGSNQLISREWLNRARSRWDAYVSSNGETMPGFTRPVAGLDVAEYGQDANSLIFRSGGYVSRPITWGGMDLGETARTAAEHVRGQNTQRLFVDSIGVGAGMPALLSGCGVVAVGVKTSERATIKTEAGEFNRLRDQLWWAVRDWLRTDPGAMLPPDEQLIEELSIVTYEVHDGKIRIMAKDQMKELLGRSPDRADSLCLTFASSGFFGGCSFPTF